MSKVVVVGATGKQGGAVASLLLERGHEVVAFVRSEDSQAAQELANRGAQLAVGDLREGATFEDASHGVDAIFGLSVPFGEGGLVAEVLQGRLLADTAARGGAHLVYSSVRGANRVEETTIDHMGSKQQIEAYLRDGALRATVLGPVYFMENLLADPSRLAEGLLVNPLSPTKQLDQITVLDIAGMAVHAIENPIDFVGKRVDIASDQVSGVEAAQILSDVLGREIWYQQLPIEQVRQYAGDEIADMFLAFEASTEFVDIAGLRAEYPNVNWHSYGEWASTVDWDVVLRSTNI